MNAEPTAPLRHTAPPCVNCSSLPWCETEDGRCVKCDRTLGRRAALLGAEAGTPDDSEATVKELKDSLYLMNQDVSRLTSEVRALREERDAAAALYEKEGFARIDAQAEVRALTDHLNATGDDAMRDLLRQYLAENDHLAEVAIRLTEQRDASEGLTAAELAEIAEWLEDGTCHGNEFKKARKLRALSFELSRLREENDTMLRELVAMLPGSRWADALAARLASPSPTGAP